MCHDIARHLPGNVAFHDSTVALPPSRAYYFSHYSFVPRCLAQNPSIWDKKLITFYTHPRTDVGVSEREYRFGFKRSTKIFSMCSEFARLLVSQGIPERKVEVVLAAADPEMFRPHRRAGGAVGLSQQFLARKSPDLLLEIVRKLSHRDFVLLGREWRNYERFGDLERLPNFTYAEVPYADYGRYYDGVDVFLSLSELEGGPIPLIETMMCNAFPVASRTGFAPDIIRHGENGLLFDVGSDADTVCELVEQAFEADGDVRSTVEHLTWERYAGLLQRAVEQ
jgi:glycosyltransferase involved in cell wall biosynthesis